MENYDIFLSYRRFDDNGNVSGRDQARLICNQLTKSGLVTYYDDNELKDGDFKKLLISAIEHSKAFILVLTKDSMNRCCQKDDMVTEEIKTAIKSKCKLINVSPDNSFDKWPDTLPESIKAIVAVKITPIYMDCLFESSIDYLIKERIIPAINVLIPYEKAREIKEKLYQYAIEYEGLMREAERGDITSFRKSAEVLNNMVNLYRGTRQYCASSLSEKLDKLLEKAEKDNSLSSIIELIQEFNIAAERSCQ